MARKLTPKQQAFVEAYAETRNGTESARRAGYSGDNLDIVGCNLLKNERVAAALSRIDEKACANTALTVEWLIERAVAEAEAIENNGQTRVSALKLCADILGVRSMTHKHEGKIDLEHHASDARGKLAAAASRIAQLNRGGSVSQYAH